MQEIMKFENNDVEIIQNKNGETLFEIYGIKFYKKLLTNVRTYVNINVRT